jgi:hypothetical protein
MAWRVIAHGDDVWHVHPAAERRANAAAWHLVFAFRREAKAAPARTEPARFGPRTLWAAYPIEAPNKAAVFAQADRIPDHELEDLLKSVAT